MIEPMKAIPMAIVAQRCTARVVDLAEARSRTSAGRMIPRQIGQMEMLQARPNSAMNLAPDCTQVGGPS